MQSQVNVRPATPSDCEAIRRIATETWHATYSGHIPDEDIDAFLEANYSIERLERSIERLGDGLLLASLGEQPAGYAMVSRDADGQAQLWSIYALPEFQGRGVGKALWDAALDRARALGLATLVLWVLEDNQQARAFYERQGARAGEQRDYPVGETAISEVQYELQLG